MGEIIVTRRSHALNGPIQHTFRWEGDDTAYISAHAIQVPPPAIGATVQIGPFLVRVLDYEVLMDRMLVSRERGLKTDLRYLWHRAARGFDLIYHRSILTLAVWGLAEYQHYRVLSWRDVHALKRLAQWEASRQERRLAAMVKRINEGLK